MLYDNYGVNRDIDLHLGRYVLIADNTVGIEILKQEKLKVLILCYTDLI